MTQNSEHYLNNPTVGIECLTVLFDSFHNSVSFLYPIQKRDDTCPN